MGAYSGCTMPVTTGEVGGGGGGGATKGRAGTKPGGSPGEAGVLAGAGGPGGVEFWPLGGADPGGVDGWDESAGPWATASAAAANQAKAAVNHGLIMGGFPYLVIPRRINEVASALQAIGAGASGLPGIQVRMGLWGDGRPQAERGPDGSSPDFVHSLTPIGDTIANVHFFRPNGIFLADDRIVKQ